MIYFSIIALYTIFSMRSPTFFAHLPSTIYSFILVSVPSSRIPFSGAVAYYRPKESVSTPCAWLFSLLWYLWVLIPSFNNPFVRYSGLIKDFRPSPKRLPLYTSS